MRVLTLVVAALVALTGCSPQSEPSPSPRRGGPSATAATPTRDDSAAYRALDICALIPAAQVKAAVAGIANSKPWVSRPVPAGELGACAVSIVSSANFFRVGSQPAAAPGAGKNEFTGQTWVEERSSAGVLTRPECAASKENQSPYPASYLTAPDGQVFAVTGTSAGSSGMEVVATCRITVELARLVGVNLATVKPIAWPAGSLAAMDLCTVVEAPVAVAGGVKPWASKDRRRCGFTLDGVGIRFEVGVRRTSDVKGTTVQLSGVPGVLTKGPNGCLLVDHGPQSVLSKRYPGLVEWLVLRVDDGSGVEDCRRYLDVAAVAVAAVHERSPFPT